MRIVINKDESIKETEVVINCKVLDENILKLIALVKENENVITGTKNEKIYVVKPEKIYYFESVDKKTFIYTKAEVYETHFRLYEIEEKFSVSHFFRASKSTIINISKIDVIKPIIGGRVEVLLENKEKLIVSRQYVPVLKQKIDY